MTKGMLSAANNSSGRDQTGTQRHRKKRNYPWSTAKGVTLKTASGITSAARRPLLQQYPLARDVSHLPLPPLPSEFTRPCLNLSEAPLLDVRKLSNKLGTDSHTGQVVQQPRTSPELHLAGRANRRADLFPLPLASIMIGKAMGLKLCLGGPASSACSRRSPGQGPPGFDLGQPDSFALPCCHCQ